jgi:hypothetical protein
LQEHALAVQIDVDEEKEVSRDLRIRSMPTVLAFRGGVELDRVVGLRKPNDLLSWLQGVQRGETQLDQARRIAEASPDDMQARYSLARTLANAGRFEEATDEYAWLWQHVLEHRPSMLGVRGSYMLSEIGRLMEDYRPARKRFADLRDALAVDHPRATAPPDVVRDWIALSVTLGEADRVLGWFDTDSALPDARPYLQHQLVPLLIERGRWADVARWFHDPLAALRESHGRLEELSERNSPPEFAEMRPQMIEAVERIVRRDAGVIVASLLAARRDPEARVVLHEVRRLMPGADTERVLLETAMKAGVQLP